VVHQVEIEIKYEGYFQRQLNEIEKFKNLEKMKIPGDFDFWALRPGSNGQPEWKVVCHYNSLSNIIEGQDCEP